MFDKISQVLEQTIGQALPSDAIDELKHNVKGAVQGQLEQMNLVTREQFDIQEKILRRTRDRLTELEQQIERLEKEIAGKS